MLKFFYRRPSDFWVSLGSTFLIITALGHVLFVDASLAWFIDSFVEVKPSTEVIEDMKQSTVSWSIFGSNQLYKIMTGLSLWLSFSFVILAILSVLVFRGTKKGTRLRSQFATVVAISLITFTMISAFFFILPPIVGGALGTLCFGMAFVKEQIIR